MMKPYYSCAYGDLYLGDCLDILPRIDNKVQSCITSPPYFDRRDKCYDSNKDVGYPEWLCSVFDKTKIVLEDDASIFVNIKEHVSKGVRDLYVIEFLMLMIKNSWRYSEEFIWVKTNPFPSGNRKRLKDSFERIFQFNHKASYSFYPENVLEESKSKYLESEKRRKNKKGSKVTNGSGMDMSKRVATDLVRPGNVIQCSTSNLNLGHPAMFPRELPDFFIKLSTMENQTVLDPFSGSGTTALSCIANKRKFICVEKEEKFCELSAKRIEEHINKMWSDL